MITDSHTNLILSRFETAAALQHSALYFDVKACKTPQEKELNNMVSGILVKESKKMVELGIEELKTKESISNG